MPDRSAARLATLAPVALALFLAAAPAPGGAQPARPVPTVGFVGLPTDPSAARFQDGFVRGLRDLGYVPGQTIRLDVRSYRTRDQVPAVLQELVRQKVGLLLGVVVA